MHAPFDTSVIQRLFTQLSHNRICDLHMQNRPYFARKGPHISTKLGHTHTHVHQRHSINLLQKATLSSLDTIPHQNLRWNDGVLSKQPQLEKNPLPSQSLGRNWSAEEDFFFFPLSVDWLRIFHKMVYAAGGTGFGGWLGVSFCSSQYIHRIMTQFLASLKELWIETVIEGRYEEMYFSTYLL